jgi:hypothetical protein
MTPFWTPNKESGAQKHAIEKVAFLVGTSISCSKDGIFCNVQTVLF